MEMMLALIRRFRNDKRGNIAIMAAGGLVLAISLAAFGVDLGAVSIDRRKNQAAADIAAIVAASNIQNASLAVSFALKENNIPSDSLEGVELGVYSANAGVSPSARFIKSTPAIANAARVTLKSASPLYFGQFLTGSNHVDIRTTATAATTAFSSFSIGSRMLSINGGILNSMLGAMLGANLQLSVLDYQALLGARVDLFDFMGALATRVDLKTLTNDQLLATNLKATDILAAVINTQPSANAATTALTRIATALSGSSKKILASDLIGLGPYSGLTAGVKPALGASVSVSLFDLVSAVAGLVGRSSTAPLSLDLGIPGIAGVTLRMAVDSRSHGASWVAVGAAGATVRTAAARVFVEINLLGSGVIPMVRLPLFIDIAPATATLKQVNCGYPNIETTKVTLSVLPGILDAWIGEVSDADLRNFAVKLSPPAATLVDLLSLVKITGRAHAAMGNTTPTNVEFSYAEIKANNNKKTVTTTSFSQSLMGSLLGDLQVGVTLGPLGLLLGGLGGVVTGIISAATGPVDQIVSTLFSTLGIGLGQADVWVSGVRCDGAVLVN